MRLTVLGCSGSVPGPDSPASGYLLQADGVSVAFDLGNGTLGALQRVLDPFDLDALVLSHLHPDHCADVPSLVVYRRHHPEPPHRRRLPLHAPTEAPTRLAAASATSAAELATTDLFDVFDFRPLGPRTIHIGGFEIAAAGVEHPCESYALRVSHGGRCLVYTGDTGPCALLAEFAAGTDLLLAEASWLHDEHKPLGLHLSGRQAGELAAAAGAYRLLLTHIPPWTDARAIHDEACSAYDGPVELVRAGADYDV
ncbi:MAG: MBL fold metallo-hydrolase [Pseudonocardiaceae bacterium]|nr:MBL fold metallo-hydrolase [Pseudonocardiaceae bacterium]